MVTTSTFKTWAFAFFTVFTLLWSSVTLAAPIASASVSSTKVSKDEVFQLKVSINTRAKGNEVDFTVLEPDFFIGRPSFGSYQNSVNGNTTLRSEWTIALAASRLGVLTIPSFTVNGVKTKPISIQVSLDSDATTQEDVVELTANVDKTNLYIGETTQLHTKLILKADPRRLQNSNIEAPQGDGIQLVQNREAKQYQTVLNGIEVTIVEQAFNISADKEGELTLSPPRLTGALIEGNNRGRTRMIPLDISAKPITLHIKAKPSDYQGAWLPTPKLTLEQLWQDDAGAQLTSNTIQGEVGNPISRTLVLKAKNLSQAQLPNLVVDYPDSIRVYQEPASYNQDKNGVTTMTVKQVLIAKQAGEMALPKVGLNWWNSEQNQAERAEVNGATWQVSASEEEALAAPLIAPSLPTKTITVTDAGYWPYLSAVLALLWIITTLLWLKARKTPVAISSTDTVVKPTLKSLYQAIDQNDGIAFNQHLQAWSKASHLTAAQRSTLQPHIDAFLASLYASDQPTFNSQVLKAALKQSQAPTKPAPEEALAKL